MKRVIRYSNAMNTPESIRAQLIHWRRYLHQHPEPSFEEHETARYIEEQLRGMEGLEISRPTATSVLAILRGAKEGNTVLLRADIDALPIEEENTFDFISQKKGVMHACGHDGHTAILLGTARLLSENREEVSGEIRFIFQHAEELAPGGAEELVTQTSLMDGVDVVTGLHLNSGLPTGVVAVKEGEFMASPDTIELTIHGKGGHAGYPQQTIDPIAIGAQVVTNLQHLVSRQAGATDALVVTIAKFQAGTTHNVIPDSAELMGTVRTFDPVLRENAARWVERVIRGICEAHGATYTLRYTLGYRPVVNTAWVARELQTLAEREVGSERFMVARPVMGAEDFSAYLVKADGAYFNVGSGSAEADSQWPHHHPRFTIDEEAMLTGVQMMVAAALHFGEMLLPTNETR